MGWDPDVARATVVLSRVALRSRGTPFTSDDLRDLIEAECIALKPQAIGKALAEAKVGGWIRKVGETPSRRAENHRRLIDQWVLTRGHR